MKQKLKITTSTILALALLAGCGSVQTLGPGAKTDLADNEKYRTTRCETIPRTYSGVAYVLCTAYIRKADSANSKQENGSTGGSGSARKQEDIEPGSLPGSSVIDLLLSGVVDTLVLPYTLYKQFDDGSYQLNVDPEIDVSGKLVPRKDY